MNIALVHSIGFILLGIWLIVTGLLTALSIGHRVVHVLLAILAIAAGVFILIGR